MVSFIRKTAGGRVMLNVLTNFASKFVIFGTWFFLTPFFLDRLGPSAYGIWILVGSLMSYGSLFDFGFADAVTKYVAEFYSRNDSEQARSLVATTLRLYTLSGLVVILIGAAIAPSFSLIFKLPEAEKLTAGWVVFLSSIGLGISLPGGTTIAVLRGLQRFDLVNLISITGMLLYALMAVLVLSLGGGLVGIVAANIPLTLFMLVPQVWIIYRIAPELRFGCGEVQRRHVRSVTSYGGALFVINLASQLKTKTDEILIGMFLPIRAVTPYYIAHRLSEIPLLLTEQFMRILMPLSSQMNAAHDQAGLRRLYLTGTRVALAIFMLIGGTVVLLADPFLTAWVGVEYVRYTELIYILVFASLLEIMTWPAGAILQGISKHHILAPIAICSGVMKLIITILLIRTYGVFGVAWGTLLPYTIETLVFVLPYTLRTLEISVKTLLAESVLPVVPPALIAMSSIVLLKEVVHPVSFLSIGLVGGAGFLINLVLYLAFGANLPERNIIIELAYNAYQAGRARIRLLYP